MDEAYSAGSIFVDVIPSYRKLVDSLRRDADSIQKEIGEAAFGEGLDKEASSAGRRTGKSYAGAFEQELKRNIGPALKALGDGSDAEVKRIRSQLEKLRDARIGVHLDVAEFRTVSREILAEVDRLGSRSPNIQVKTDTAAAAIALRKLLQDVNRLDGQTVNIQADADVARATGKLNALSAVVSKLSKGRVNINVDADTGVATGKLGAVHRLVRMISGMRAKVNVDVDIGAAVGKLAALRLMIKGTSADAQDGANAFRAFNAIILAAVLIGPILVPVLAAIAGGLALIATAATGVVAGLGVMILGFSGVSDAVKALADVEKNAAKETEAASKQMRAAYQSVADARRNLTRARQNAAEADADAERALADAIERGREAEADASENLTRTVEDGRASQADAARDLARAVEDAAESQQEAERALQQTREQAARSAADAARAVADARSRAADQIEQALQQEVRAQNAVKDAVEQVANAEQALRDAREAARMEEADLADQIKQNNLDEAQGVIDLFNATVEYNALMADGAATNLDKEQGRINLEQARLSLKEIRDLEQELGDKAKEAAKPGVANNDGVIAAQDNLTAAIEAQREAVLALGEASRGVDQARAQGARDVRDAIRAQSRVAEANADAISDALRTVRRAHEDGAAAIVTAQNNVRDVAERVAEAISDAQRGVRQAHESAAEGINDAQRGVTRTAENGAQSIQDAQRGVRRAQQGVQDALVETEEIGSASMRKLEQAMGKLSPAGRRFARFLFGLRDEFHQLRNVAQQGMLPGVQRSIKMMMDKYFPSFLKFVRRMARTIGGLFEDLGRRMTKDSAFTDFFSMLNDLGPRFMRQFGRMSINWLGVFMRLMTITAPFAKTFSDAMLQLSRNALDWSKSAEGTETWRKFMAYVMEVGPRVWDFFKSLFGAILNIAEGLAPFADVIMGFIGGILDFIANMDPKLLGNITFAILGIVVALQLASLAITAVRFASIAMMAPMIVGFVLIAVALVLLWRNSETARRIMTAAWEAIKVGFDILVKALKWAWENVLKPVFKALGEVFKWLWEKVVKPYLGKVVEFWKKVFDDLEWAWKNILSPVFKALGEIFKWLWEKVVKPILTRIQEIWEDVFKVLAWTWEHVLKPVFKALGEIFKWLWEKVVKPVFGLIKELWKAVFEAMEWAWDHILKPVFGFIKKALVGSDGNGGLVGVFKTGVEKIKDLWGKLKDFLATPIEWVITNVLNKGIIGGFNKIAGFFTGDDQKIGYVGGAEKFEFASGGVTPFGVRPGYTPGRDTHLIAVGGGEAIMRPEWTRAMGKETIERMNAAARMGGSTAVQRLIRGGFNAGGVVPAYSRGGVVSMDGEPVDLLTAAQIKLAEDLAKVNIYVIQGAFQPRTSYSGTTHTGAGVVDISPVTDHVVRAMQLAAFAAWDRTGKGDWGPHIHAVSQIATGVDSAATAQMRQFISGTGDGLGGSAYGPRLSPIPHFAEVMQKYIDGTIKATINFPGMTLPSIPDWVQDAVAHPIEYLMKRVEGLFDNDVFGGSAGETLKQIPEKLAGYAVDKIKGLLSSAKDFLSSSDEAKALGSTSKGKLYSMVAEAAGQYGWIGPAYMNSLNALIEHESSYRPNAQNPDSTAYGLFQFLDSTWGTVGGHKTSDPALQIKYGLQYIKQRYDDPIRAWNFWQDNGYYSKGGVVPERGEGTGDSGGRTMMYDNGGYLPPGLTTVLNLTGRPEPVFTADQFDRLENGGMRGATFNNNFYGTQVTAADIADQMMFELRAADHAGRYRR